MFKSKVVNTVSRAAKLGSIAYAAQKATRGDPATRALAKRALAHLMADARGVPMKIGQFLATVPGDDCFQELVNGVEARPLSLMLPVLEAGLGRPAGEVFASIQESKAAASLGQVHHAVLLDGTEVAVKLRYPGIADAVGAEMRLAGLVPGLGPTKKWGFDLGAYKATLKADMDRELDYQDEAARQHRYREQSRVPGLVVPRVYPQWCSGAVLVQDWETGQRLGDAAGWSHAQRLSLARTLMGNLYTGLFVTGHVHGDPHAGNMFFRHQPAGGGEVVLLDYGCTVSVSPQARLALLKLIVGCRDRDDTDPLRCLVAIGFDAAKLLSISKALPALCRLLFEPFCGDEPYSTKYWEVGKRSSALLGELRWWFRSAGPPELILLMRAFNGLVSQLASLKVVLPWWRVLVDTVGQEAIDQARAFVPPSLPGSVVDLHRSFKSIAQYLKIQVTEGSQQVVALTMPASQVPFMAEQIPPEVLEKIDASGIDLAAIVRQACDGGIVPGELFTLQASPRRYRVWLE